VTEWPLSATGFSLVDLRRLIGPFLPADGSAKRIGSEKDVGTKLQWLNANGAEVTAESCVYDDPEAPQYRLLSEMRMFGRPTVSVSEFKDAVFIQTERSLALAYNNAYIRLSYYRRYQDRGEAEDPIAVMTPIIKAIYEELRKAPTESIKKEPVVEAQLPDKKTLIVGETTEVTFKVRKQFRGYRMDLDNMNAVQKRGVTAKRIDEDGAIKVTITPVQAGQVEFAFILGSTNGNVRSGVIFLDVAEGTKRKGD
jgi:hypothetical protein